MKSGNSTALIKCTSDSTMHFNQSQSIYITNLEFIGCGRNQVRHVEEFMVKDAKFVGQEDSGTTLELIETTVRIVNSTFLSNRKGLFRECATCIFHPEYGCGFDGFIGGAIISTNSTVDISQSRFEDNGADFGGAIFATQDSIINTSFNVFVNNKAIIGGGALYSTSSNAITIEASDFYDNYAGSEGGVLLSDSSTITIEGSEFRNNSAGYGGVLHCSKSTITIEGSEFHDNYAKNAGGVLCSYYSSIITKAGSNFTNNVSPIGAIIFATSRSIIQPIHSFLLIDNNMADRYAVIYLSDSEFIGNDSGNATFSNNLGSLVAFNSNITFIGYAIFVNNTPSQTVLGDVLEGGAMTLFQSNVFFNGVCNFKHNHAENGGAIYSTESKLNVNGDVTIAHNTATGNGGGVYLSTSELNCQQKSTFVLWNNTVSHKGGGLHAISSSIKAISSNNGDHQYIYTGARINITGNAAERGGGLSLEANAKVYILKYDNDLNTITFTANSADYGGAIHVDDDTNFDTCASSTETECFFQVLSLHSIESPYLNIQSMHFSQNHANISGSTLYGGLLDRCAVSPFAEVHNKYPGAFKDRGGGIAFFKKVSTPGPTMSYSIYNYSLGDYIGSEIVINTNLSVSSDPVRVCLFFNADQNNDCPHQHYTEVKKGQTFILPVVAVDQIGQPVSATIQTSLHFTESGLAEGTAG